MTFPLSKAERAMADRPRPWFLPAAMGLGLTALVMAGLPAEAHHLMDLTHLPPSPATGLLSGLAHPVLGPDHLLFLCSLSLVGLRHRLRWIPALLVTGLLGSGLGLLLPGLPLAEAAVAFSLVVVALVWLRHWPKALLLPAIALHGYVLSHTVLGWSQGPLAFYALGLLLSQGTLLLLALTLLRSLVDRLSSQQRALVCGVLIGCGSAWTLSALVA
ncbi:MAG: HupE/UreJ family protein [Cyanobacteriota bacterium]|nr:HupE/UreJ family protein [Cyanobacteriota bacterium]